MRRVVSNILLGVALFSVASCKAKQDEKQAIRAVVMNYLSTRKSLNISAMDIDVTQTTINGNQAQAQVDFRLKNSAPDGPGMQVNYNLEKRGEVWVVVKSEPSGGSLQHPAAGEMPPGTALPPGHVPVGGASGQSPAVHPDFSEIMKTARPPAQQPARQSPPPTGKP
jgi:hypothetical protein